MKHSTQIVIMHVFYSNVRMFGISKHQIQHLYNVRSSCIRTIKSNVPMFDLIYDC